MNGIFSIMPDFLRDPDAFFQSIQKEDGVKTKAVKLAIISILCLTAYGFTVGLAKSPVQALSSAVKMPILYLLTMVFCLPS